MTSYDQHSAREAIQAHVQKQAARQLTCAPFQASRIKISSDRFRPGRLPYKTRLAHTRATLQSEIDHSIAVYLSVAFPTKFLR